MQAAAMFHGGSGHGRRSSWPCRHGAREGSAACCVRWFCSCFPVLVLLACLAGWLPVVSARCGWLRRSPLRLFVVGLDRWWWWLVRLAGGGLVCYAAVGVVVVGVACRRRLGAATLVGMEFERRFPVLLMSDLAARAADSSICLDARPRGRCACWSGGSFVGECFGCLGGGAVDLFGARPRGRRGSGAGVWWWFAS